MTVDLEAIARRGRCDVTSLRAALPLIEQGYTPPFLARYRRDELSGVDEASLWGLTHALHAERSTSERRDELHQAWEQTSLADPALGHSIRKGNSKRTLDRLARRLKAELAEPATPSAKLAVRVMNPQRGDADDLLALAQSIDGIDDADGAVAGLDDAIARRLSGDPRIMGAAVRWLAKNARIHIATISDPHTAGGDDDDSSDEHDSHADNDSAADNESHDEQSSEDNVQATPKSETFAVADTDDATSITGEPSGKPETAEVVAPDAPVDVKPSAKTSATEEVVTSSDSTPSAETPSMDSSASTNPTPAADVTAASDVTAAADETAASDETAAADETAVADETAPALTPEVSVPDTEFASTKSVKSAGKKPARKAQVAAKKPKRVSPRQRRRRWLISVLQPLAGKRIPASKLGSFQILMLSRALRSQVAQCAFEYDAAKLVAEVQHAAQSMSRTHGERLSRITIEHEADIREAAEAAWWDELQEQASTRLVAIAGDHLRQVISRGGVEAKVVMSIDAVGPRTAATTIVAADGRILHSEDLPCQLSAALRAQAVARMGELIHTHGVDLIVISNGPARRASMVAVGDLLAQSPEKSLRWTLADRSGADAYAGSGTADQEMRTTPRRFRAAAWLAFSVLTPAQAFAKVDPLKLRLVSFQRELAEETLAETLDDVMASGASRGGVDANSAPLPWLARLPGMNRSIADQIDSRRRSSLFASRTDLEDSINWRSQVESRQALAFLRVFGSAEPLDGTLVHPEDYVLAKKLSAALEIEMPPSTPPGYQTPNYKVEEKPAAAVAAVVESSEPVSSEPDPGAVQSTDAAESSEASSPDEASMEATAESETDSIKAVEDTVVDDTVTEDAAATSEASGVKEPDDETDSFGAEKVEKPVDTASEETSAVDASATTPAAVSVVIRRPKPERAKIEKCIKEWQIGPKRTHQIVNWLCDPFSDTDAGGVPPAVLSSMPSLAALKPGDQVIGVIVGVMPFGVFVELAPDCSGLIHVSKVSESYVEDLHEAVQVGDVITAWVSRIDEKRRRVALSAISPEREAELEQQRSGRDDRSRDRGPRPPRGGDRPTGTGRPASPGRGDSRAPQGAARGGNAREGTARVGSGGPPSGGGGRSDSRGGARSDSRGGGRSGGRGQGSRDNRDSRGGGRGGRSRQPESYKVESSEPKSAPISEAMEQGAEPLRSFGDLLQFYSKKDAPQAKHEVKAGKPKAESKTQTESKAEAESAVESQAPTQAEKPPADSAIAVAAVKEESAVKTVNESQPAAESEPSSEQPAPTDTAS